MTIGIYALYWEEQDLIYIGQSQNIEKRFLNHLSSMKNNKHTNYKVQNTYNLYGNPLTIIIEKCNFNELNIKEIFWTEEFNSRQEGLNISEAGVLGSYGINHYNAKYSELQILLVFRMLRNPKINYRIISDKTGVKFNTISEISNGSEHIWIQEKYPKLYKIMRERQLQRDSHKNSLQCKLRGKELPKLISPKGEVFIIENIRHFAKEYNLDNTHLGKVINKKALSHKGWKLL